MRRALTVIALGVVIALAALWWTGGFDRLAQWAAAHQRAFQNSIALSLRAVRAGQPEAVTALLSACFAYGVVHAAGPGHGKVLIGGYGAAKAVPMLRLSVIALLSSLGQAVTAVALVYTGVSLLHLGRERMISLTEAIMAPVSYGAIACVGLWLFWRGLRHFRATLPAPHDHHHHHHDHYQHDHEGICATCGHAHGPTAEQVRQATTLRETLLLIGSIAVRPCTGALFVLIITLQMGIAGVGIAGAFAMAFGTATITIAVGLGAGALRGGVLAGWASTPRAAQIAALIELAAGLGVALLAGGLLLRAI
jgi:nickel/cobalt exporter